MTDAPLLVAITGPDGSGKSTACAGARQQLERTLGPGSVVEVSVWDCLSSPSSDGSVRPAFESQREAARYLADLDGTSRTLFIFHAMARALDLGIRKRPKVLLLSGYWYKYAVSEIGYGVDADFVIGAALGFARPTHVICLDIDPQTAWERRKRASLYEQGGAGTSASLGEAGDARERERFLKFQGRLREAWIGIEAQSGQAWEHLSALEPAEQVARQIAESVLLRLGRGGHL